jgi:hypothetical protein
MSQAISGVTLTFDQRVIRSFCSIPDVLDGSGRSRYSSLHPGNLPKFQTHTV